MKGGMYLPNKLYDKIKHFFKENWSFFLFLIFFGVVFNIRLPYYIKAPGGLANVSERLTIEGASKSEGSYNLAFVSEMDATIPSLLIAYFHPDWDIVKKEEIVLKNETEKESTIRSHLLLEEANQNAIWYAYQKAGKEVSFTNAEIFVTYIAKEAETTLKVGDKILEINGEEIKDKNSLYTLISTKKVDDVLFFKVLRDEKEVNATATLIEVEGIPKIGMMITEKKDLNATPSFSFHFSLNESGSSGGLMMTLAIYDALMDEDFTKGRTIVGTGTIDEEGIVGSIAGVRYKLIGAVEKGADIFFVPAGENYEEAIMVQKEKGYTIEIVPVSTFDDALDYLINH